MSRTKRLGPSISDLKMNRFTEGHIKYLEYAFPRIPVSPNMDRDTVMYNAGIQRVLDWVRENGVD